MEIHMLSIEHANNELALAAASAVPTPDTSAANALTLAVSNPPDPVAATAPPAAADAPPYPESVCPDLVHILSLARPHQSPTETEFVTHWLTGKILAAGFAGQFKSNNLVVSVPTPEGKPSKVLFSCHTDTVHYAHGAQEVCYDPSFGHIILAEPGKGVATCLGADDGAGIWLMLQMIEAHVPGTYVFHRGEERGCIGSHAMANEHGNWLEQYNCAIAFDRPGFDEVITHQLGRTRCASDEFGRALSDAITNSGVGLKYSPSDRGAVTDTAHYRKLIPECVNIGVGYQDQHGKDEFLDYGHLVKLRDACLAIDWAALPTKRDPKAYDASDRGGWSSGPTWRSSSDLGAISGDLFGRSHPPAKSGAKKKKATGAARHSRLTDIEVARTLGEPTLVEELSALTASEIMDWAESAPLDAALAIIQLLAEIDGKDLRHARLVQAMRSM